MSKPRDIGTRAATGVARYLKDHGWPYADTRTQHGWRDRGDITGCPGVCWEIKGGHKAENAGDQLISDWLDETDTERINAGAEIGILVTKRSGYGTARVASWWAHMEIATAGRLLDVWKLVPFEVYTAPVQMHLSAAVTLLRHAGYGSPLS